jgi:hypothetical protein
VSPRQGSEEAEQRHLAAQNRAAGISIYFRHVSRSPEIVTQAWHGAGAVPRVGDLIKVPPMLWRVERVTWFNHGWSVDVLVSDVVANPR